MNDASPLKGLHAVVTGAGRGIGAAIVAVLAHHGARVSLMGRNEADLRHTAALAPPGTATCVATADVAQDTQVQAAFAAFRAALGPVHILVNNAGQAASAALHKMDDELWHRILAVNLTGTYHCARAALPDMLAGK